MAPIVFGNVIQCVDIDQEENTLMCDVNRSTWVKSFIIIIIIIFRNRHSFLTWLDASLE